MNYKKCKHDSCMRKAAVDGYCDKCIQINSKSCIYCSQVIKKLVDEDKNEKKSKHNFWIDGLEKGSYFFGAIFAIGVGIFCVIAYITCLWVWATYFIENQAAGNATAQISVFMINVIRLSGMLIVGGLLFKYFCYFLSRYLSDQEEKELIKEGFKKWVS